MNPTKVLDFIDVHEFNDESVSELIENVTNFFELIPNYDNIIIECSVKNRDLVIGFKNEEAFESVVLSFCRGSLFGLNHYVSHDFHLVTLKHIYNVSTENVLRSLDELVHSKRCNTIVLYSEKPLSSQKDNEVFFSFPPNVIISLQSLSKEKTADFKKDLYELLSKYGLR